MDTQKVIKQALEVSVATKALEFGEDILDRVPGLFNKFFPGQKAIVFADKITWKVAGERVFYELAKAGVPATTFIITDDRFHPDWKYVEMVDKVIEDLLERNPNTSHPDTVGEDDRLEIKIREAKDGKEVEGGWEKDGFYFNMSQIKNKTQRKKFIDKEVGSEFIVNFAKVFGSEEEAAKILGEGAPAGSDFNIIIDDAIRNEKPELDEDFFKKIFPDKDIKELDTFKQAVKAEMEKQHDMETDPILFNKMIDELVAAVHFDLPDDFMKRWLVENSQGNLKPEDVEKNYEKDYVKGLRWQLIEDSIVKANPELIITDEEVKNYVLKQIFPGIDYNTVEDDMKANLDKIAANYLKDPKQNEHLKNQLADIKMTSFLKGKMNINYEDVTAADFMKKLEEERKAK